MDKYYKPNEKTTLEEAVSNNKTGKFYAFKEKVKSKLLQSEKYIFLGTAFGTLAIAAGTVTYLLADYYSANPFTSEDALSFSTMGLSLTALLIATCAAGNAAKKHYYK